MCVLCTGVLPCEVSSLYTFTQKEPQSGVCSDDSSGGNEPTEGMKTVS